MYDLTLHFKTASKEDYFNFPKSNVTKYLTQSLIANLTNKPLHIFHITYLDSQGESIDLTIEDDYLNAKEYTFNQTKIANIFVTTDQEVKFAFQEDYKVQTSEEKQRQVAEEHAFLTKKEIMEIKKHEKRLNKKAKKQKQKVKKEEKKNKNKSQALSHQKNQVFQQYLPTTKSKSSLNMAQRIEIQEYLLNSFLAGPKVETPPQQKGQSGQSCSSTKKSSKSEELEQTKKQVPKCSPQLEAKNSEKKLVNMEIKEIDDDEDVSQLDKQASYEFQVVSKQADQIDRHSKMKQQILSQLLALLPKYIKAECFKGRPEVDVSLTDLLPTCFNCKKHLKPRQLRKMQKKRAYEEKKKESMALNQQASLSQQKHFETKK